VNESLRVIDVVLRVRVDEKSMLASNVHGIIHVPC